MQFSEWTLTTSQKFDLFAPVFGSLIPNTTSSTDVLLRHYNHNSAISSENDSAKEIYLSNHGRSLNIRIGQNHTTYTTQRGSPQLRRKSVLDFLWKYTLRKYKRHLNGELGICFMWTRYTSFTADFMFPKHDISVCEKCILL